VSQLPATILFTRADSDRRLAIINRSAGDAQRESEGREREGKANKSEDYQKPATEISSPCFKQETTDSDNTNFPKCLHREEKIETVEMAEVL